MNTAIARAHNIYKNSLKDYDIKIIGLYDLNMKRIIMASTILGNINENKKAQLSFNLEFIILKQQQRFE